MSVNPGRPFRFAFVGDIYLGPGVEPWLSADVPDLHRALSVDVVVGNFESVVDGPEVGNPHPGKIHLSTPRSSAVKLKDIGVDVVSVANNHIADYGPESARHTVAVLDEVFGREGVFGLRERPAVELAPGLRVAAACFPETNPVLLSDELRVLTSGDLDGFIERDVGSPGQLMVYAHWGEEYLSLTAPGLRERASRFSAAGVAHVVGTHSHVVGAAESLGCFTATYSLGNFLFHVVREGNTRLLGRTKRGTVAVFSWDGTTVTPAGFWRSEFDEGMNLLLKKIDRRHPGSSLSQLHLKLPESLANWSYERSLSARWFSLGLARLVEGVERPSFGKLRTAARQLGRRQSG